MIIVVNGDTRSDIDQTQMAVDRTIQSRTVGFDIDTGGFSMDHTHDRISVPKIITEWIVDPMALCIVIQGIRKEWWCV